AGLAAAVAGLLLALADRVAALALALADPALVAAVAEVGNVDGRHRDGHEVLPLLADHLALLDEAPQVLLDLAAHDRLEAGVVLLDAERHARIRQSFASPRAKIDAT